MRIADWFTIAALIIGPLLAVQVTMFLERKRQANERQFMVFRTLMATRATGLSSDHVQALNMIDIEFAGKGKGEKDIREAWQIYLDHLNNTQNISDANWTDKRVDLFAELLYKMAHYFHYDFDKVHLKRSSYFPKGHGDLENDQNAIRKALVALLNGDSSLPIKILDNTVSLTQNIPPRGKGRTTATDTQSPH